MKPVTPRTFYEFKFISNPKLSLNGRMTAFLVKQVNAENNSYDSNLYVHMGGDTKQLTNCNNILDFLWKNDDAILYNVMDGLQDRTNFYEICPENGHFQEAFSVPVKAARLTQIEPNKYLVLGKYENHFSEGKQGTVTTLTEVPYWGEFGASYNCGQRLRLYFYDADTGECLPITAPEFQTLKYDVHDGVVAIVGMSYSEQAVWRNGLWAWHIKERKLIELIPQNSMYISGATVFGETILFTGSDCGPLDYQREHNDFFVISTAGGQKRCIIEYEHNVFGGNGTTDVKMGAGQAWKRVGDRLYLLSTRMEQINLYSVDLTGDWREEICGPGFITGFDMVESRIVYSAIIGSRLNELYEGDQQLTHLNDGVLEELILSEPVYKAVRTSDGFEVQGWVLRPTDYISGKKYPAIFHIHGGPPAIFSDVFHCEQELWANRGYFVFFCNPRGSDGRGTDFRNLTGKHGDWDYVSLMDWLDGALEDYPEVDRNRLGVTGGSYGGYMTNWIITHTNRFAAAVSQRSISDWVTFEYTAIRGWWLSIHKFGTRAGLNPKPLWEASPLRYTECCKTPTLFIQSDNDHVTPLGQALAMFGALKAAGCQSKMCIFHGEDHELSRAGKPENRVRRMEEILAWFDHYLEP